MNDTLGDLARKYPLSYLTLPHWCIECIPIPATATVVDDRNTRRSESASSSAFAQNRDKIKRLCSMAYGRLNAVLVSSQARKIPESF
ncbi:hypothetical protein [Burkholderia cepacia]|uniref:hypothetical protein n=1 Tax=Burkholderia cepacia TaxID=292 RepID=UPI002AB7E72C|nr:hypothetical protein [Burkholderia cepacia]